MNPIGVYWSVMHRRPQDYAFFQAQQPSVFKIMDGGPPDYAWARDNLPNSLIIARDWAMSEQHEDMLKNPLTTGERHAIEWDDHQRRLGFDRAKTLILGINEPRVWEPGVSEALRLYTIALCEEATRLGLRVGAMQLSVGWPNNDGPDTPPNWSAWHGVDNAIRANNGALVCHEYWADSGPGEMWGWWGGRVLKCPWQVPIVIGECGIDMYVKDGSVQHLSRGWRGRKSPEQYAAELADYTGRMSADERFIGCAVFAADYANGEWASFDIEPAYNAILSTPIPTTPPHSVHLPSVGTGQPSTTAYVGAPVGARIRFAPSTESRTVELVPYRARVDVVGSVKGEDGAEWAKVQYDTAQGYIRSDLLRSVEPPIPVTPPPPSTPSEPVPAPGDNWTRSREFVKKWEGGYSDNPEDHGNWTGGRKGQGELKGTKYGISAASYPHLDIRNLTMAEADAIYFRDYWQASNAASLPWPYCLLAFDTAVLHGVGTSKDWQEEVGNNPLAFAAKRLRVYTNSDNWKAFGAGWVNRVADLLLEASKP